MPAPVAPTLPLVHARWLVLAIFVVALLISGAFIWIPDFWADEAATIWVSSRSLPDFLQIIGRVDAVHASYYGLVHFWSIPFGYSTLGVRSLSALAVALTSVVIFFLGRRLLEPRLAPFAALTYPLVPLVMYVSSEARSATLSALLTSVAMLAGIRMMERPTVGRWMLALAACIAACWVFIFSSLALPALVAMAIGRGKRAWVFLAALGASTGVALAPLLLRTYRQSKQVSWIGHASVDELLRQYATSVFARGSVVSAVTIGALGIIGIIWSLKSRRPQGWVVLLWLLLPALVLGATMVLLPSGGYFLPRYLVFTVPALVLLMAGALQAMKRAWVAWFLALVLVVGAVPEMMLRLDPMAKSSWSEIRAVVLPRLEPGDALIASNPYTAPAEVAIPQLSSFSLLNDDDGTAYEWTWPRNGGDVAGRVSVPDGTRRVWMLLDQVALREGGAKELAWMRSQGFSVAWASNEHLGPHDSRFWLLVRLR